MLREAPTSFVAVVARWLESECGCHRRYVGIRWPPAFLALLADVVTAELEPIPTHGVGGDCCTAMQEYQVYSVWLLHGVVATPTAEEITAGFDQVP